MFDSRVRYIIRGNNFTEIKIGVNDDDPIGWDKDTRKIERSKKSMSFITKNSENLEFVKSTAEALYYHVRQYGTESQVFLTREEKNPKTNIFEEIYTEALDLKDYVYKDGKFKTKFLSGGFDELIKSQLSEKFELDRKPEIGDYPTDIKGNRISELQYKMLTLPGRKLFLRSLLTNRDDVLTVLTNTSAGNVNFPFATNISYESDDYVQSSNITLSQTPNGTSFDPQNFFYINKGYDRTFKVSFDLSFNININAHRRFFLRIAKGTYTDPTTAMPVFNVETIRNIFINNTTDINESFEKTFEVKKNEGLILYLSHRTPYSASQISYAKESVSIKIEEDSVFAPTNANALLFHEAAERQIEIITGDKTNFRSDYFKTGQFKDLMILSGKMIRKMPKLDDDQKPTDEFESITTSLKDLLSASGYFNLGYGIEKIGNRKVFVIEALKHFFRNVITINAGDASEVERGYANDYAWKSFEFGNEKAGEYKEQQGLFETNAKNTYTTHTTLAENVFDGISKLRSDMIGMEHCRRKSYAFAPTEDTPYDKENFIVDTYQSSLIRWAPKTWHMVLDQEPKGVYDPLTTGNHLLTPFRSLQRHGWLFNTSLGRFPEESVRYASSTGYPKMTTKIAGEVARAENGTIKNKELGFPRLDDEIVKFKVESTFELRKQIYGSFVVNGRELPNVYGLVEFINEFQQKEYGFVISIEESEMISFEVIKSSLSNG